MAIVQRTDVMLVADAVSEEVGSGCGPRLGATCRAKPVRFLRLAAGQRELRLDLFRGLALWLIYIDHVSPDLLTWFTIRNYGFSDAAEIFIFISGFTAALVYGRATFEKGIVTGNARSCAGSGKSTPRTCCCFWCCWRRSLSSRLIREAILCSRDGRGGFFKQPGAGMIQVLLLRFRPLNMDVLPLYVVLMCTFR